MTKQEQIFVDFVFEFYKAHGRHELPWRKKTHLKPYNILVSEMMLQQTQVARVVPKYQEFLKRWPTAQRLQSATLGEVLRAWQGLGYNRRAKFLLETAKTVTREHKGRFPKTFDELQTLPGIGAYTAAAVMNFAYNEPVRLIETNVRTVYIHHFFKDDTDIPDSELLPIIERTQDIHNPREWYWALMDYGAYLKQAVGNQNTRSTQYVKQSKFQGSDRQIRGAILRRLAESAASREELHELPFDMLRIDAQTERLLEEGLLLKKRTRFQLP